MGGKERRSEKGKEGLRTTDVKERDERRMRGSKGELKSIREKEIRVR